MTWLGKYSCIIGMLQHSHISNFIYSCTGWGKMYSCLLVHVII